MAYRRSGSNELPGTDCWRMASSTSNRRVVTRLFEPRCSIFPGQKRLLRLSRAYHLQKSGHGREGYRAEVRHCSPVFDHFDNEAPAAARLALNSRKGVSI